MYNQEVQHKVKFEVINDKPKITIGIRFNDFFTQDTYMLISESPRNFNRNNIAFNFSINKNKPKTIYLNNLDVQKFLNECFFEVNDFDFQEYFTEEIKISIAEEIVNGISQYEKDIVLNEISYEGEIRRMKELSGLKNKFLF